MECSPTKSNIDQIREATSNLKILRRKKRRCGTREADITGLPRGVKVLLSSTKKHHRGEELTPSTDFKLEMINGRKMKSGFRNSSWTTSMIYTNHEE